ncbi:MAG: hypothetical protein ACM30I_14845 [Gemmatimonas sp.]
MRCSSRTTRSLPSRLLVLAVGAMALASLSGCGLFSKTPQFDCPKVEIPKDLATMTRFRDGGGRDLTDVVFNAGVLDVQIACDYGSKGVDIQLNVVVGAERGPASRAATATIPYFIAIGDPQRNILAKEVFSATVEFQPNVPRAYATEETEERIPLPKGRSAEAYGIIVGLQLSPADLEYNRARTQR